jgi:hypothetical protein
MKNIKFEHVIWFLFFVFLFAVLELLCGCAAKQRVPVPPNLYQRQMYERFRDKPCTQEKLDNAYGRLLSGVGCPECALYFMRCAEPSEWKKNLRKIKARRK